MATKTLQENLKALYDCVQTRPRPEDVAELVLEVLGPTLSRGHRATVERAASNSLKRSIWGYSSMANDFARATNKIDSQVKVAAVLFNTEPLSAADCLVADRVIDFIKGISPQVQKVFGMNDPKTRLNREQRKAAGIKKVQRWYNKRWRLLVRMEQKIERLAWNQRKYLFTRIGKSALSVKIPFEDFAADVGTACFVAYQSARMSMRSVFTNKSQDRAFDEVSKALFNHARSTGTARWDVIAYVLPDEVVLSNLSEDQKGRMLGTWWNLLVDMADMLKEVWRTSNFDRQQMIVTRGNDSSTWNQVAGGWNKAREHWISLVHAVGMEGLLEEVCPGKVMRLMAADVAYWHRMSGGDVHPDTKVWGELPAPWEVVHGEKQCGRRRIEEVCAKLNLDPKGWTCRTENRQAVAYRPTPELVHGVAVSSAHLAKTLRRAGVFSGKGVAGELPDFSVQRDENGFALRAEGNGV